MTQPQFSEEKSTEEYDPNRITYFGITDTRNKRIPFGIKQADRDRHTYVIGKTGMGKSTLLENMAVQDIQNGEGLCFIDPHGGTAERIMEYIPESRVKDVLYFAPFDLQYPISFNVLENVDADKRHLVVAGLMSAFEKIWVDAWSARMAYILQNTIGALLEFPGATLLSVNRMYIDKEYRKNVVAKVTDPSVRSFWVDEFTKYTDRYAQEATPAIQNKIGQFASNALVRNVIGQEESSFDLRRIMDEKKIFIVNLSKGRVGEGNANLLGSMLITKIYLAAMSRADVAPGKRTALPPFYLFVDEFQNFANKSFAEILSEARKYKLSLTIAHQYIEQMEDEVRAAVFGNVGTMMAFRVGAYDAEVLEKEFAPTFEVDDLVNLGQRQIYLKLMIDSVTSQPFSAVTMPPIPEPEINQTDKAIAYSRAQYSRPREEVEKSIKDWTDKKYEDPEKDEKERARLERRAAREAEGTQPQQSNRSAAPPFRSQPPRERTQLPQDRLRVERNMTRSDSPRASSTSPRPQTRTEQSQRDTRPRQPQRERREHRQAPPLEKDKSSEDLKDILAKMTKSSEPAKQTEKKEEQRTTPTSTNNPSSLTQAVHSKAPARDDGKSVTDEGKQQLRDLLSSLAPPQTEKRVVSEKPKENSTPAPQPVQEVPQQATKAAPKSEEKPPKKTTRPSPKEVEPEQLKKVLHVDKPNLDK